MTRSRSVFYGMVLAVFYVAVSAALLVRFYTVAYNGDALYDAQVARNVLSGKGHVTSEMPLYALTLHKKFGWSLAGPWVNIHKFPLPVFTKLLLIKFFGDSLFVTTFLYSWLFSALGVFLIYVLGLRLWPSRPTFAFWSAFVFIMHPALVPGTPHFALSGLNLQADVFFFVLLLHILYSWYCSPRLYVLAGAGAVAGLAFLNRYNAGLYVVAIGITLLAATRHRRRHAQWWAVLLDVGTQYTVFIGSFLVFVGGLVLFNLKTVGLPFVSINGLFQLWHDTPYSSFMDPWYKLEYVFSVDRPWEFFAGHAWPLLAKWARYLALDIVRFATFEGVLWWLPLVLLYYVRYRRFTKEPAVRGINVVLKFSLVVLILQLLLLPLWSGSQAYFYYLFSVFVFPVAYALVRTYEHLRFYSSSRFNRSEKSLLSAAIVLLALPLVSLVVKRGGGGIPSMLIAGLAVAAGMVIVGRQLPRAVPLLTAVTCLLFFGVYSGFVTAPHASEILRHRWDLEPNQERIATIERLSQGGVSLSTAPWNVVWWSGNRLISLPLPEYPDEVFTLESEYGQHIDSLYLARLSLYPPYASSYSWEGYRRLVRLGSAIAGFSVIEQDHDNLVLARTSPTLPRQTQIIDFGEEEANSHLIWGWGQHLRDGARTYTQAQSSVHQSLVGQGPMTRDLVAARAARHLLRPSSSELVHVLPYPLKELLTQHYASFFPMPLSLPLVPARMQTGTVKSWLPQAEITFLVQEQVPQRIEIVLRPLQSGSQLLVVLNGNLRHSGQEGVLIGRHTLREGWQTFSLDVPKEIVVRGVNKLSFVFLDSSGLLYPAGPSFADFDLLRFFSSASLEQS